MNKSIKEEDFITKEINKIIAVLNLENVRNYIAVEGSTYANIAEAREYLMLEDLPIFNDNSLFSISNITYEQILPHFKKRTIDLYNMLKNERDGIEEVDNTDCHFFNRQYEEDDTHILVVEDVEFSHNVINLSNWFYFTIIRLETKQYNDEPNIISKRIMIYFLNSCIAVIPVLE